MPPGGAPGPAARPGGSTVESSLDRDLARDGWSRRFVGAPPRLQEMADLYRSMGHEVLLQPVTDQDLADHCAGCLLATSLFRIVYTRRRT